MTNDQRESLKMIGMEVDAALTTVMSGLELTFIAAKHAKEALDHAQQVLEGNPGELPPV